MKILLHPSLITIAWELKLGMLWFYFNLQFESVLFLFQSLDQSGIGSATTITPFVPEESFWLVFSTYQLLVAVFIA